MRFVSSVNDLLVLLKQNPGAMSHYKITKAQELLNHMSRQIDNQSLVKYIPDDNSH